MLKSITLRVLIGLLKTVVATGGAAGVTYLVENVRFESIVAEADENVQAEETDGVEIAEDYAVAEIEEQVAVARSQTSDEDRTVVSNRNVTGSGQMTGSTVASTSKTGSGQTTGSTVASTNKTDSEQKTDNAAEEAAAKKAAEQAAAEQAAREQAERETTEISVAAQVEAKPVTLPAEEEKATGSASGSGSISLGAEEKVTTDYGCAYCGYYAPDMDSLYKHFNDAHPQEVQATEPKETIKVYGCSCGHHDSDYDAFMEHMAQHALNDEEPYNYNWWHEYLNGEICYDKEWWEE